MNVVGTVPIPAAVSTAIRSASSDSGGRSCGVSEIWSVHPVRCPISATFLSQLTAVAQVELLDDLPLELSAFYKAALI